MNFIEARCRLVGSNVKGLRKFAAEFSSPDAESVIIAAQSAPPPSKPREKLQVAGLFAGIGGLEEGFRQAGHSSAMLCELDAAARGVLARHFTDTEIVADVTSLASLPPCDVLTAGFPCQDLSQAGRRRGITGPNSGLVGVVFDLLRKKKEAPRWVVLENVPFMLNLSRGAAIRSVTSSLDELGYNWAYRTIDTRAFGLPQRRRRVLILASKENDPRPALLGCDAGVPKPKVRGVHACGFYWTEGNTGLGWAVDCIPPLKGCSGLHIPSPPAIWFPRRRLIATPSIEDAERLQGFPAGWTANDSNEARASGKRWRMVGNAVSVPIARWLADRLTNSTHSFEPGEPAELPSSASWPSAGWGMNGVRSACNVSDWPLHIDGGHLAAFLNHRVTPLSHKATTGFFARLTRSNLRYERAFAADLAHHIENVRTK